MGVEKIVFNSLLYKKLYKMDKHKCKVINAQQKASITGKYLIALKSPIAKRKVYIMFVLHKHTRSGKLLERSRN